MDLKSLILNAQDPEPGSMPGLKVVFLNGPPGSGKDTAGRALEDAFFDAKAMKFAEHLKRSVLVDFGLPRHMDLEAWDLIKEMPLAVFDGLSFRQACIRKSEKQVKPFCGEDFYGRMLARSMLKVWQVGIRLVAITDSGFVGEAERILRIVSPENALLLRLHAEGRGKSFIGDSRSYLELPGVTTLDLDNDDEERCFREEIVRTVSGWAPPIG